MLQEQSHEHAGDQRTDRAAKNCRCIELIGVRGICGLAHLGESHLSIGHQLSALMRLYVHVQSLEGRGGTEQLRASSLLLAGMGTLGGRINGQYTTTGLTFFTE